MIHRTILLATALTTITANAGTLLTEAKSPIASAPAPVSPAPRLHPNAHGAHRPTPNLATADGLGFSLNIPYESILYYRGTRVGENGMPFSLDMDVKITDHLTWANNYKFIQFLDDDNADSKVHLWSALLYQTGNLVIGPHVKFHRNNSAGSLTRDVYDIGLQALYDLGPVKIGAGYSYDLESSGHYIEAGLCAPLKITPQLTITPAAEINYTDGWIPGPTGLANIALRLTAVYKFRSMFAVAPFVAYNIPLEVTEDRYKEEFIAGAALHVRF